jgi:hypothetical protein
MPLSFKLEFEGYSIYFILHALTLITALTWHGLLDKYLGALNRSDSIHVGIIYAIFITILTVILHMMLGKKMIKPSDADE